MSLILILTNQDPALPKISDYRYEVLVGDGTAARSRVIARGEITGHRRTDGWRALVQTLLDKDKET